MKYGFDLTKEDIFEELCDIEFLLRNLDRENGFKEKYYSEETRINMAIDKLRSLEQRLC